MQCSNSLYIAVLFKKQAALPAHGLDLSSPLPDLPSITDLLQPDTNEEALSEIRNKYKTSPDKVNAKDHVQRFVHACASLARFQIAATCTLRDHDDVGLPVDMYGWACGLAVT